MQKGYIRKDGYRAIYVNNKQIMEHRYFMEKFLGRKLESSEIVHHKDHNKLNNNINNLILMSRSEHKKEHNNIGENTRFKKGIIINSGVKNGRAKLNKFQIQRIRLMKKISPKLSYKKIGKIFKVSSMTIYNIILFNSYKYE